MPHVPRIIKDHKESSIDIHGGVGLLDECICSFVESSGVILVRRCLLGNGRVQSAWSKTSAMDMDIYIYIVLSIYTGASSPMAYILLYTSGLCSHFSPLFPGRRRVS